MVLKKQRGLEIIEQDGDGNCLFRAISLQVYGDANMHSDVRKHCMDHMVSFCFKLLVLYVLSLYICMFPYVNILSFLFSFMCPF